MHMATWSNWKRFPNPERGGYVEAPIGAGLYEVRRISNGSLYDFNASGNVALALSSLTAKRSGLRALLGRGMPPLPLDDLEYRTCASDSLDLARTAADRIAGRREAFVRGAA
jgi:hypothetical protein